MTSPTVAVVGDNTVDRYVGAVGRDYVGGNAVNVAVQLAERGFDVRYFGVVGTDAEGARIRAELAARGVDLEGLSTRAGASALTVIRVDESGDRHIEEEYFGVTGEYVPDAATIDAIASADWVQIGMLPRPGELRRALRAVRPEIPIGQDCSVSAGYADLTVAFESTSPEAAVATATNARDQGATYAVVTLGEAGSLAVGPDGTRLRQAAAPAHVVDTTGAGDSFIAGFVSVFARGGELAEAMATGADWAARTCGHLGGFAQDVPAPSGLGTTHRKVGKGIGSW